MRRDGVHGSREGLAELKPVRDSRYRLLQLPCTRNQQRAVIQESPKITLAYLDSFDFVEVQLDRMDSLYSEIGNDPFIRNGQLGAPVTPVGNEPKNEAEAIKNKEQKNHDEQWKHGPETRLGLIQDFFTRHQ